MKFSEVLKTVDLVIESGEVPLIIGESGIGKTSLVKEIAKTLEPIGKVHPLSIST